ncbi:hypothetical protein CA51_13380 [Rosistilla oblonga]|uniref:hypothetical protein n=1 Tax=Rosistilla oblonga TaxID=2527990 RepID=UPI00118B856C|nr:hypothetical protein [Rosistilla oblonga]QDV11474.1 hypothetical protein CA51_13380 [Rosistilla oblonga]
MTPQLTITAGGATFAVVGMSTAAAGTSAVILATGGAPLLIGGGLYRATRNGQTKLPRLEKAFSDETEG